MISLYFLELTDILQPAKVGFRCHDRTLSMPYIETGDELIPLLMLLSLAFAGPAASVSTAHLSCLRSFDLPNAKDGTAEKKNAPGVKKKTHGWMLHGNFSEISLVDFILGLRKPVSAFHSEPYTMTIGCRHEWS